MTARQTRTERRAAERKAKKLARKAANGVVFSRQEFTDSLPSPERSDGLPGLVARVPEQPSDGSELPPPPISPSLRAQINRDNAQHSTGPRTPEGKLASSRNSLKHGLASAQLLIPGENRADFDALLADLFTEHQPASPVEELLVHQIAQSWWLTQRALRFQNECFTAQGVDEKRLSLFLRYQTTHERAFHKALSTLIRLKKDLVRGFVSQNAQPARSSLLLRSPERSDGSSSSHSIGFVSQNPATDPLPAQFVSQNEPSEIRFSGALSGKAMASA